MSSTNNVKVEVSNRLLSKWKSDSRVKLKAKIRQNLTLRGNKTAEIVNNVIRCMFPDGPPIYTARDLIDGCLVHIDNKVDEWKGVHISVMSKRPETFLAYHKRADNWWNRYKSEWIGDFYFYPLFKHDLMDYIMRITHQNQSMSQVLFFMILYDIIRCEVQYHRAKAQPLILDQCYIKSADLQALFCQIGMQHNVPWDTPMQDTVKSTNYRHILREYATKWAKELLERIKLLYSMRLVTDQKANQSQTRTTSSKQSVDKSTICSLSESDSIQPKIISLGDIHEDTDYDKIPYLEPHRNSNDDTDHEMKSLKSLDTHSLTTLEECEQTDFDLQPIGDYGTRHLYSSSNQSMPPTPHRYHPYRSSASYPDLYGNGADLYGTSAFQYPSGTTTTTTSSVTTTTPTPRCQQSLFAECQIKVYNDGQTESYNPQFTPTFSAPQVYHQNVPHNKQIVGPKGYNATRGPSAPFIIDPEMNRSPNQIESHSLNLELPPIDPDTLSVVHNGDQIGLFAVGNQLGFNQNSF